jgi:hypothetical protein
MKRLTKTTIWLLLACMVASAQSKFQTLQPGRSTKDDAERVLGQPVSRVSETLSEYKAQHQGQKIYIQYGKGSPTIERIEVLFSTPVDRSAVAGLLELPPQADSTNWDSKGRLEEYFGAPKMIVLTLESSTADSPVRRVGYYSRELFAVALSKPQGQPQASTGTQSSRGASTSAPFQPAVPANAKAVFVPEGTKLTAVTTEKISSKTAEVGDPVILKVKEPVVVDGVIVIDKGATVKGSIVTAEKRGGMGKSGKLAFRVESTTAVDGQEISLRVSRDKDGGNVMTTVSVTSLFAPFGLLIPGEEAFIKAGLKMKLHTDEEKRVFVKN